MRLREYFQSKYGYVRITHPTYFFYGSKTEHDYDNNTYIDDFNASRKLTSDQTLYKNYTDLNKLAKDGIFSGGNTVIPILINIINRRF